MEMKTMPPTDVEVAFDSLARWPVL